MQIEDSNQDNYSKGMKDYCTDLNFELQLK